MKIIKSLFLVLVFSFLSISPAILSVMNFLKESFEKTETPITADITPDGNLSSSNQSNAGLAKTINDTLFDGDEIVGVYNSE